MKRLFNRGDKPPSDGQQMGEIIVNGYVTDNLDVTLPVGQRTANLLTLTNLLEAGGVSSQIAHAILTDQAVQDTFLENAEALLRHGGTLSHQR